MPEKNKKDAHRTRTVTWEDPMALAEKGRHSSGLDLLRSIKRGDHPPPPIARLLGYRISDIEKGRAVFEIEPAEYHYNPMGTVHGCVIGTILDTAMTAAIMAALPEGSGCTTVEFKVNFIRPVTVNTGKLTSEAGTIHVGRKIATAQGRLTDNNGKLVAHAVTTCSVFPVTEARK